MFPNIQKYKTTSTEFMPFSKPIKTADYEIEEKMVSTFTSRSKRKYINLKQLRDAELSFNVKTAIDELAELYPDYSCFAMVGAAEILEFGATPPKLTMFRLTASRNDKDQKLFISVQLKYESIKTLQNRVLDEAPILIPGKLDYSLSEDCETKPVVIPIANPRRRPAPVLAPVTSL